MDKDKDRKLVLDDLENEKGKIRKSGSPVKIPEKCLSIWSTLNPEITNFLETHGEILFALGGSLGREISLASENSWVISEAKNYPFLTDGLIIGTNEGELLIVVPGTEVIYSLMSFADEILSYSSIFELVAASSGLLSSEDDEQ